MNSWCLKVIKSICNAVVKISGAPGAIDQVEKTQSVSLLFTTQSTLKEAVKGQPFVHLII